MHIERIHEMMEDLTKKTEAEFDKGIEHVDAEEMCKAIKMIKELAEAEYYAKISKAMDESEYGEDYDVTGPKRYYDGSRGSGRTSNRGGMSNRGSRRGGDTNRSYDSDGEDYRMSADEYRSRSGNSNRDMDRESRGRMYYTEPEEHHEMSRIEKAREKYRREKNMDNLTEYVDAIRDDLLDFWASMPSDQRTTTKTKLTNLINKM